MRVGHVGACVRPNPSPVEARGGHIQPIWIRWGLIRPLDGLQCGPESFNSGLECGLTAATATNACLLTGRVRAYP